MNAYEAGLKPWELNDLEWREIVLVIKAHQNNKLESWKQSRMIAWTVYAMNTSDKKPKTMEKLFPLYGDEKKDRGERLEGEALKKALKIYQ